MNQKQAKVVRKIIQLQHGDLPLAEYELDKQTIKTKQFVDLMGNMRQYQTATIQLSTECQRKKYKQLKKVGK